MPATVKSSLAKMSEEDQTMFQKEFEDRRKSTTNMVLLAMPKRKKQKLKQRLMLIKQRLMLIRKKLTLTKQRLMPIKQKLTLIKKKLKKN